MKRLLTLITLLTATAASAQICLMGDDAPHGVVADGDFGEVWSNWRTATQPPYWTMRRLREDGSAFAGDAAMGLHYGRMYGSAALTVAESKPLEFSMQYQTPHSWDLIRWELGADVEYTSRGTLSLSLLFGEIERPLAQRVKLVGSDGGMVEHFSGEYRLTAEDAAEGLPRLRVRFEAENSIKVWCDYINIYVDRGEALPPQLTAEATAEREITLTWRDKQAAKGQGFNIYRAYIDTLNRRTRAKYELIKSTTEYSYRDQNVVAGRPYTYLVTRSAMVKSQAESHRSNRVTIATKDSVPPKAPEGVEVTEYDTEVTLKWRKNPESDIYFYSVSRYDELTKQESVVCKLTPKNSYNDMVIPKSTKCIYRVYAHDFSGNTSEGSRPVTAMVKAVRGASFSDLILPLPITSPLSSDTWGAEGVRPRDLHNGIESPEWSYWGGRPVKCSDGKYRMVVTRWREDAVKGHWEWPKSTVALVESKSAVGRYRVVRDVAYDYAGGLGHNPDIILMRDGTYALYSLINWRPMIFTSKSMAGEWELLGEIKIDMSEAQRRFKSLANLKTTYQFERNLSGVELEDGSILMVTKFGAMMRSKEGLLGTYEVLTPPIKENTTIPERLRNLNYEDPVIWRDSVQFHMIINAFLAKRAIYLRSPNGIDWHYETGLAYTKDFTTYSDGTVNRWDKLERPHIIQDERGRATHLSLAVIDIDKDLDYGSDNHSSKNIIIPLQPSLLVRLMNRERVDHTTRKITIRIEAEEGFDPQRDLDLETLRLGASSVVNFGGGYRVESHRKRGKELEITFTGDDNGVEDGEFALKLIGRRVDNKLVVGYCQVTE
ncbi:MAG: hypothetical protein SNG14_00660 [Rikenellaceae bacterium]